MQNRAFLSKTAYLAGREWKAEEDVSRRKRVRTARDRKVKKKAARDGRLLSCGCAEAY